MKKQLLTTLFILCAVCAEAQVIWTVKAGAGISNFSDGPYIAWKAGVGADIPLSDKFMFIPAVEIAQKNITMIKDSYTHYEDSEEMFIQIPLQFGYKLRTNTYLDINFKLGPYIASPISHDTDCRFDYGIDAGIDFGHKHFVAGIDLQVGLPNQDFKHSDISHKATAVYLILGYRF